MLVRRLALPALLAAAVLTLLAAPASARWFGGTMKGGANVTYGCESAAILGALGGVELAPTGQRSCTYRHSGYFNLLRPTALVPGNGRIKRIQVKVGSRPAKLRLTILTGSSRVDTFTGEDLPGTYTCCTARYVGPAFRPKANAVTTLKVDVPVHDLRSKAIQNRIHSTDVVAISAAGPGTLPLHATNALGGYETGTPLLTGYWPLTKVGEPRVDGYTLSGIDLLFRWDFRPTR
ncbi:MAG TPA: hypothetical protein VG898_03465 [Solirubrobacterales bacterium]|nr:hypothetical protein [Solirubrobacterales bacterium]